MAEKALEIALTVLVFFAFRRAISSFVLVVVFTAAFLPDTLRALFAVFVIGIAGRL